jgi:hypothetical protein
MSGEHDFSKAMLPIFFTGDNVTYRQQTMPKVKIGFEQENVRFPYSTGVTRRGGSSLN